MDKNTNKKNSNKSTLSIVCYVVAIFLALYACYAIGGAISYLSQYFAAYDMSLSDNMKDVFSYVMQSALSPVSFAIIIFVAGKILAELKTIKSFFAFDCDCDCECECVEDEACTCGCEAKAADEVDNDPAVEAAFGDKAEAETFEEDVVDAETPAEEVSVEVEAEAVDVSEFVEKE
jgi:hypothetical protein